MMNSGSSGLDIDLAGEVQQLLFPKGSPVCSWCCIGVKNRMAQGLGGDYFEFITQPDECEVVLLGDVTGHGVHASVVMALIYGFIHESASQECDPLETVSKVNTFLRFFAKRSSRLDHFFSTTLFFSIIDPRTLRMEYVNAGHVTPMLRRGDRIVELETTTQPLGFFDAPEMGVRSIELQKGDRLLLYTDGLVETFDAAGRPFGAERLRRALREHRGGHLDFLEQLFAALADFGTQDPPEDDCTAIVLDLNGPLSKHAEIPDAP